MSPMLGLDTLRSAATVKLTPQACLAACEELAHGELFDETEAMLKAVGDGGVPKERVERINAVRDVVKRIAVQCKVTEEQVAARLKSIEHLYILLKQAVREERGIGKEDPRYRAISNVTAVCATLHGRILALTEALHALTAAKKPVQQQPLVKAKPLAERDTGEMDFSVNADGNVEVIVGRPKAPKESH